MPIWLHFVPWHWLLWLSVPFAVIACGWYFAAATTAALLKKVPLSWWILAGVIVAGTLYHVATVASAADGAAKEQKAVDAAALSAHLAADAKALAAAELAKRTDEYKLALAANAASQSYEQGKADAQSQADSTVAGLRAGNLKLRNYWQGCEASRVSNAEAAARELDAEGRLREESSGRIVRAVAECQAQRDALQKFLIDEHAIVNP